MNPTRSALATPTSPGDVPSRAGSVPALSCVGTDVAVLIVADLAPGSVLWGWSRLVRGPGALRGTPGLRFAKVMGSGHEGRFGLRPSRSVQGLFGVFSDLASAAAFVDRHALVDAYRSRAAEHALFVLRAWSSRGHWSGQAIGTGAAAPAPGTPVVALTRASIRPREVLRFWRHAPATQRSLEIAEGCRFAVGLGEAPLLRQATFSLWDDVAAMDAYARQGAHQEAIRAAGQGGFFAESMFVRFDVLRSEGAWQGQGFDG